MANFVLVHGSWAGGWQWADIREILESKGHRVLTPSLTGMADRHHLINEDVGLFTHVDDISRLIEWEQLELDDGDFLELVWMKNPNRPTVVILPGLEGNFYTS